MTDFAGCLKHLRYSIAVNTCFSDTSVFKVDEGLIIDRAAGYSDEVKGNTSVKKLFCDYVSTVGALVFSGVPRRWSQTYPY